MIMAIDGVRRCGQLNFTLEGDVDILARRLEIRGIEIGGLIGRGVDRPTVRLCLLLA